MTSIVATHYHPDHIGIVSELMAQGVTLLLVDTQRQYVHFADDIFRRDERLSYEPINEADAVLISCDESRSLLQGVGIEGKIIPTTSHSSDSISLILDNGLCFVGDLEPIEYLDAYGGNDALKEDWARVMACDPKIVYYAHMNEKVL